MRTFYEQSVSEDGTVCYVPVSEKAVAANEASSRNTTILLLENRLANIASLCGKPGASLEYIESIVKDRIEFAERQLTDLRAKLDLSSSDRDHYKNFYDEAQKALDDISAITGWTPLVQSSGSVRLAQHEITKRVRDKLEHLADTEKQLVDLKSSFNLAAGHRDHYQKLCQEHMTAFYEICKLVGYPHIEGATISIDGLVSLVREKFKPYASQVSFWKDHASSINDQLVALRKETDIIKRQRDILALDKQTVINVNEAFRNQIENLKQNEDLSKRLFAEKEALIKQNEALTKEIIALKKKPEEPEERKERISKMETVTFKDQIISVLNNKALKGDAWMNINTFTELLSKNIYSFDVYTDKNLLVEGIYGRWSNPDRQICVSQYVPEGVIKLDSKK